MILKRKSHEQNEASISPELATPAEYATLFAGARKRERAARLQSAGRNIHEAYEGYEATRRPAERGTPSNFTLIHGEDGITRLAPYTGVDPSQVLMTVSKRNLVVHATHQLERRPRMNRPNVQYEQVPSTEQRYRVVFGDMGAKGRELEVTFDERDAEPVYGISTIGDDQYGHVSLSAGYIKSMGSSELLGQLYQIGAAELQPEPVQ